MRKLIPDYESPTSARRARRRTLVQAVIVWTGVGRAVVAFGGFALSALLLRLAYL